MAMVHNSIFRGYNTIYHQASHVKDVDKADFVGYCLTWYKLVHTHAENEEAGLFLRTEELLGDETIFVESHEEHGEWQILRRESTWKVSLGEGGIGS